MDPSTRVGPFINQVLYRGDEECRGNEEIKRLFKVTGCVLGLYWDIFDDDFLSKMCMPIVLLLEQALGSSERSIIYSYHCLDQ